MSKKKKKSEQEKERSEQEWKPLPKFAKEIKKKVLRITGDYGSRCCCFWKEHELAKKVRRFVTKNEKNSQSGEELQLALAHLLCVIVAACESENTHRKLREELSQELDRKSVV